MKWNVQLLWVLLAAAVPGCTSVGHIGGGQAPAPPGTTDREGDVNIDPNVDPDPGQQPPQDPCDLSDFPGFDGIEGEEGHYIHDLLGENECAPGWPPFPRRYGSITTKMSSNTTVAVGLKGSFFDLLEGELSASGAFGMSTSNNLLLIKTSPGGATSLTRETDGEVVLDYEPGIPFVAQCTYTTGATLSSRFLGKVRVAGNGVDNETAFSQATETYQNTNFFHVKEGDTIDGLRDLCELAFDARIRDDVAEDLKNILAATVTVDADNIDSLYLALSAALYGPKLEGLTVFGHRWTIPAASWTLFGADDSGMRVHGTLTHWVPMWWGDDVEYEYTFVDGELVQGWTSLDDDGAWQWQDGWDWRLADDEDWQDAARKLTRLVAEEALLEFRPRAADLDPAQPLVATLYEHASFEGDRVSLNVGNYNSRTLEKLGLPADGLSSLQVPRGLEVTLHEDTSYGGKSWSYDATVSALPDGENDEVSSVTVRRTGQPLSYQAHNAHSGGALVVDDVPGQGGAWLVQHTHKGGYRLVADDADRMLVRDLKDPSNGGLTTASTADLDATEPAALWSFVRANTQEEAYILVNRADGSVLSVTDEGISTVATLSADAAQRWRFSAPPQARR